jgi:hypothetical protein
VKFDHVRFVGTDECNIAAFFAAFGVQKVAWGKQWLCAWCSAEDDVGTTHVFLE